MNIRFFGRTKRCKTAENVAEVKANNVFSSVQKTYGELSDDEMDSVSGGTSGSNAGSVTVSGKMIGWRCPSCQNDCWGDNGCTVGTQQKSWYCLVCEVMLGKSNAPTVNQAEQGYSFPKVTVTVHKQ